MFNCPFCDGWEHRDQAVVVIDAAPGADHLAGLFRSWTPHVTVVSAAEVVALIGDGSSLRHVVLRNGSVVAATAAFVKAPVVPRRSIASARLRIRRGRLRRHQDTGTTSHRLVSAAGDLRRPPPTPHQVILAAAAAAAIDIHRAFVAHTVGSDRTTVSSSTVPPT